MSPKNYCIVAPNFRSEERTRSYYQWRAQGYDAATLYEIEHHREAIALAAVHPGEQVLEISCGTGRATVELAHLVGPGGSLNALDLSEDMLSLASKKVSDAGLSERVSFKVGSALCLPYPDEVFDMLYNAYLFDLIAEDLFPKILAEFRRVLKPGGRLVLLNMSKNTPRTTFYEFVYRTIRLFPCRPVAMDRYVREAGFIAVERLYRNSYTHFIQLPFGAEIVTAHTPE